MKKPQYDLSGLRGKDGAMEVALDNRVSTGLTGLTGFCFCFLSFQMKLRNSNLPSGEGKAQRANNRRRFTARCARGAKTAEEKGIKTGEAQKSRSIAAPLMNSHQGFFEGPSMKVLKPKKV